MRQVEPGRWKNRNLPMRPIQQFRLAGITRQRTSGRDSEIATGLRVLKRTGAFNAAGSVNAVGSDLGNRVCDIVWPEAAGKDQRQVDVPPPIGQSLPVGRLTGAAELIRNSSVDEHSDG